MISSEISGSTPLQQRILNFDFRFWFMSVNGSGRQYGERGSFRSFVGRISESSASASWAQSFGVAAIAFADHILELSTLHVRTSIAGTGVATIASIPRMNRRTMRLIYAYMIKPGETIYLAQSLQATQASCCQALP